MDCLAHYTGYFRSSISSAIHAAKLEVKRIRADPVQELPIYSVCLDAAIRTMHQTVSVLSIQRPEIDEYFGRAAFLSSLSLIVRHLDQQLVVIFDILTENLQLPDLVRVFRIFFFFVSNSRSSHAP